MRKLSLIFAIFFTTVIFSQSKLNNYKYVLVPVQFEFQRSPDIHQINSLTKFLFNKVGFTAFLTNESFPDDLAKNRCNALTTRMINSPTFLSTRVTIELVDCNNNVVFTTRQGKSRLKDYRKSYNEAIRAAFKDIEQANYHYKPIVNVVKPMEVKPANQVVVKEKVLQKKTSNIVAKKTSKPTVVTKVEVVSAKYVELKGKYNIGDYGTCAIVIDNKDFKILSGDENFEIAKVYKTSKPNLFIVKWTAFKQPQLLQLTQQGNLKIDTKKGVREYKRIN